MLPSTFMETADSEMSFGFASDGPFFPMVATFLLSTVGLGPVYESDNPLKLSAQSVAGYRGFVEPELRIDLEQIRQLTQHLAPGRAVQELCGMLIISAHTVALDHIGSNRAVLESPTFEFFRHIRNAAAHGNRFTFGPREPRRMAKWRDLTLDRPTHAGIQCFGNLLIAADALALLGDIQNEIASPPRN
jgi:hypothetical protein